MVEAAVAMMVVVQSVARTRHAMEEEGEAEAAEVLTRHPCCLPRLALFWT